jgi:hypothetical protein
MFSAIRSSHRRLTPIDRLTAALSALAHARLRRHLHVGASAIVRAGLLAVLVATTAIILHGKLASIASRSNGGEGAEEQAPEAGEE